MTQHAKWSDLASMDGPKTLAAASQLLPGWISLILVILIGWQLAQLVWSLVPAPAAGDAVVTPVQVSGSAEGDAGDLDVNAISAHIFGIANAEDVEPVPVPEEHETLPETRLSKLSLKGTIAADPAELSVAIIADGGNKEQVYVIGSSVTSGAELHAVYADRVVLNENGALTNLMLPKDFPEGTAPPTRRNTTASIRPAPVAKESIQSVVAQNVSKLSDVIRPTPYFVDGQQQGYRVYPGRNRQQFTALGLRPGDLVKDIDGQSLTDPTQAMKIFQTLGNSSEVSITVERNGQPETIILRTDQLDIADETDQ